MQDDAITLNAEKFINDIGYNPFGYHPTKMDIWVICDPTGRYFATYRGTYIRAVKSVLKNHPQFKDEFMGRVIAITGDIVDV